MYKCKKFNYVNIDFETVWEFSKQVDVVESAEADYKKKWKRIIYPQICLLVSDLTSQ